MNYIEYFTPRLAYFGMSAEQISATFESLKIEDENRYQELCTQIVYADAEFYWDYVLSGAMVYLLETETDKTVFDRLAKYADVFDVL